MARRKKSEQGDILERQSLSLEFRKCGMTYRDIAKRTGVSFQQAHRDVNDELQRLRDANLSSADELRQLELERLDRAIAGMMHWIDAGSPIHVQALVKCIQERSKLLGLYEPEKQQVDVTLDDRFTDEERANRVATILERARARRDGQPPELIQ